MTHRGAPSPSHVIAGRTSRRVSRGPVALMLVGLLLLAASWAWPSRRGTWTNSQQQALQAAGLELQQLVHGVQGSTSPRAPTPERAAQIRAAQETYARLNQDLTRARQVNHTVSRALFWTGLALAAVGLAAARGVG